MLLVMIGRSQAENKTTKTKKRKRKQRHALLSLRVERDEGVRERGVIKKEGG